MDELLQSLNDAQREAVTTTEGYVRVIAGAGSGKTRALSYRFAYLVNVLDVSPKHILCSTFTNKAANEMRQRIRRLTGGQDTGYVCTFHSLCVAILQEDGHIVHYPKNFRVMDNSDVRDILSMIYEEHNYTLRDMSYKDALDMIQDIKCRFLVPDWLDDLIYRSLEELETKYRSANNLQNTIFYGYLYHQKRFFGVDFNDLFFFTLRIFQLSQDSKLKWQRRFQYIMVDEFQDIGVEQMALMDILGEFHKNVFVVGDSDQTIYSWRGSKIEYFQNFVKEHNGAKSIFMNINYRSTPEIIAVCNSLIEKNKDRIKKELESVVPSGKPVLCYYAEHTGEESLWICDEILKLHDAGVPFSSIAVLYRAHYVTRSIEQAFLEWEIPYRLCSGTSFYERKEIKDALSYLSMLVYQDDLSFLRVINTPKRNIGKQRVKFIQSYAKEHNCSLYEALKSNLNLDLIVKTDAEQFIHLIDTLSVDAQSKPAAEILSEVLDKSGYEAMLRTEGDQERLDNLAELKQSVFDYEATSGEETTLIDYLQHIALLTNSDVPGKSDMVKMMTIHAAKGLEFQHVFVCGLNEGIIPTKRTDTPAKMEEERRLAFVAMTRAERGLYLSCAEGFHYDGTPRYPSRFLLDIDKDLMVYAKEPSEGLINNAKAYIMMTEHKMMGVFPKGRTLPDKRRINNSSK